MKMRQIMNLLENTQTDQEIHELCIKYGIVDHEIVDGRVDTPDDVRLSDKKLPEIPVPFGVVDGNFYFNFNAATNLKNAPLEVHGEFAVGGNQLTTLVGCPQVVVMGDVSFVANKLTTLEGCVQRVYGGFACSNNELTTLGGGPIVVVGEYFCAFNRLDYKHYVQFSTMDKLGRIRTDESALDNEVNNYLNKCGGDLSSYKQKIPLNNIITRFVRDNTQ